MISIQTFNDLTKFQKCVFLWQEGTFISNRFHQNGYSINLYHTCNFYAEVWYNGNKQQVGSIRTFKKSSKLEPYLDKINIEDIYNS